MRLKNEKLLVSVSLWCIAIFFFIKLLKWLKRYNILTLVACTVFSAATDVTVNYNSTLAKLFVALNYTFLGSEHGSAITDTA